MFLGIALPEQAFAWGPGVHMVTGNWILQNLPALPAVIAAALVLHPAAYLRGSLSPDIFIGKGSRPKKGHSHNWESGFSLLDRAENPQQTAYACGYLSHLAADVVAHNVFVPGLFHTMPGAGKMAHVYLEAQADRLLAWDSEDAFDVLRGKNSRKTDVMLRSALRQRAFPFWIKKRLFEGSVALGGTRAWRGSIRVVDALVRRHERGPLVEHMMTLSARAIVNVLGEQRQSPLLAFDPIGADALNKAAAARAGASRSGSLSGSLAGTLAGTLGRLARRPFAAQASGGRSEAALDIPVPPVLETFPPLCTSDGMIPE